MATRTLYIAAYDIRCPRRLRKALHLLREYASGRQKSVFEVFLDPAEKQQLMEEMAPLLEPSEDRFFLLQLSGHRRIQTLGIAITPVDGKFIYLG